MNYCTCGGEVDIRYEEIKNFKTNWFAICRECEKVYAIKAKDKATAIQRWNNRINKKHKK